LQAVEKNEILLWWKENIANKKLPLIPKRFSGSSGYELEQAFKLPNSNKNSSDFSSFELKLFSKIITFGD
jgi:hypothetical protein